MAVGFKFLKMVEIDLWLQIIVLVRNDKIKIPIQLPKLIKGAPKTVYGRLAVHDLVYNSYFNPTLLVHCFNLFSSVSEYIINIIILCTSRQIQIRKNYSVAYLLHVTEKFIFYFGT